MRVHVAMYGNVSLGRAYCWGCRRWALVLDGLIACCNRPVYDRPTKVKRMCEPEAARRRPSAAMARHILAEQGNSCLYCDRPFDSVVWYGGKVRTIKLRWDHMVPWNYGRDNRDCNFAAACQICNSIKSNRMFMTVEEVRAYVQKRWADRGGRPEDATQDL